MINAESIYVIANVSPTDFGVEVVPSIVVDPVIQRNLAVSYIDTNVLPSAISEVSVPFLKVSGGQQLPVPDDIILRRYPAMTDMDDRDAVNDMLQTLWDTAAKSFARAEINKLVATNAKAYDEDSDQDRRIANQQLKKLLEAVHDILTGEPNQPLTGDLGSRSSSFSQNTVFGF